MMVTLLEPLQYEFMQKALVLSVVIGGVCALLSVYLMLKGWSLIGDALSHSVVPGVAVAYILGLPYALGAFFTGLLAALSMLFLKQINALRQDAIIGFVFSAFFALGLLIITLNPMAVDLQAVIYGTILAISPVDFWQMIAISLVSLAILYVKWRDLMLLFFDETQAVASGLSARGLQILFFALVSAAVVAALQAVGAILVIALLITPGATAFMLAKRFSMVLIIAFVIGVVSSVFGTYFSFFLNTITGAVIVLIQSAIFVVVFIFAPGKGLLAQYRIKMALAKSYKEGAA